MRRRRSAGQVSTKARTRRAHRAVDLVTATEAQVVLHKLLAGFERAPVLACAGVRRLAPFPANVSLESCASLRPAPLPRTPGFPLRRDERAGTHSTVRLAADRL